MFVWMMVILKIPIAALPLARLVVGRGAEPREPEPAVVDDPRPVHGPDRPLPRRPRPPRRGPHAEPAPRAPTRVRARGRTLTRSHR